MRPHEIERAIRERLAGTAGADLWDGWGSDTRNEMVIEAQRHPNGDAAGVNAVVQMIEAWGREDAAEDAADAVERD